MTREIKFRAWDKNESMLHDVIVIQRDVFIAVPVVGPDGWELSKRKMADVELMQFTGLLDKNGKEIYEGDVVHGTLRYPKILDSREETGKVEWSTSDDSCRFRVLIGTEDNGSYSGLQQYAGSLEIIGNVWEHPDLIKGV